MRQEVLFGHSVLQRSRHTPLTTLKAVTRGHDEYADALLEKEQPSSSDLMLAIPKCLTRI